MNYFKLARVSLEGKKKGSRVIVRASLALYLVMFGAIGSFVSISSVTASAYSEQVSARKKYHAKKRLAARPFRRRIYVPIVPYTAYDYPYYYSRGYYPRHIGPGYIYNNYHVVEDYRYGSAKYPRMTYSAEASCARRFKSYDRTSGLYTTFGGQKRRCGYSR